MSTQGAPRDWHDADVVSAPPSGPPSGLPEWVQWVGALSPLATALIAATAALVAFFTLRQRRHADARSHWWDRTRWAVEQATSANLPLQVVGVKVLALQSRSRLADAEQRQLINVLAYLYAEPDVPDAGDTSEEREYIFQEMPDEPGDINDGSH